MNKYFTTLLIVLLATPLFAASSDTISNSYYKSYNYEKMQNYDDAIKSLSPVYASYPNSYTINYRLGYLHYVNKLYANAASYYKAAVKAAPYSIEPKLGLMSVLLTQGKFQDAEAQGYQIINTDYYNYYGNLKLAYTLRLENKLDLSEKIVLKMLDLYPIDGLFLAEYGILKYLNNDFDKAFKIFNDILILDPENITANTYIALMTKSK